MEFYIKSECEVEYRQILPAEVKNSQQVCLSSVCFIFCCVSPELVESNKALIFTCTFGITYATQINHLIAKAVTMHELSDVFSEQLI